MHIVLATTVQQQSLATNIHTNFAAHEETCNCSSKQLSAQKLKVITAKTTDNFALSQKHKESKVFSIYHFGNSKQWKFVFSVEKIDDIFFRNHAMDALY